MIINVLHFLQVKEKQRVACLANLKTREAKKTRNKRKSLKLVEDTKIAKRERARRQGKYGQGINLDGEEEVRRKVRKKASRMCALILFVFKKVVQQQEVKSVKQIRSF